MANEKRLIDANELGGFLLGIEQKPDTSRFTAEIIRIMHDVLNAMPTIDAVEVVHGRWKDVKETSLYVPDMKYTVTHTAETCSACNVRIGFIGSKPYLYDNICPNCGAKMDGGKDDGC